MCSGGSCERGASSGGDAHGVDVAHPSTVSPARAVMGGALSSPATRCEPHAALVAVQRRPSSGAEPARRRKHNTLVMFPEGQARGLRRRP
jgi:hypothetical protein